MLNAIWIGFFLVAFAVALVKTVFFGQPDVFVVMMKASFDTSKTAFEVALGLMGRHDPMARTDENRRIRRLSAVSHTHLDPAFCPPVSRGSAQSPGAGLHYHEQVGQLAGARQCRDAGWIEGDAGTADAKSKLDTASNAQILPVHWLENEGGSFLAVRIPPALCERLTRPVPDLRPSRGFSQTILQIARHLLFAIARRPCACRCRAASAK